MDPSPIPDDVRAANRRRLRHLGFGRIPLDAGAPSPGPTRDLAVVVDRALALHVVVAVAGGLEVGPARRWLDGLEVASRLMAGEADYLADVAEGVRLEDAARATGVEALAVLLWSVGLVEEVPHDEPAGWAATVLPGPGEPVHDLVAGAALRPAHALRATEDLVAGMSWAIRDDPDLEVGVAPGPLDPYVIRERHRAIRWVLGDDWSTGPGGRSAAPL